MADGYRVIVKINLPPAAQYASGHSIIVQGDTGAAVAKTLDGLTGVEGHGELILAAFVEHAISKAVEVKMQAPAPELTAEQKKVEAQTKAMMRKANQASASGADAAHAEVVEKVESDAVKKAKALRAAKAENTARPVTAAAPAAETGALATPAYLKVVAKKTGKSLEELQGLTKEQAKGLVEEASK